MMFDSFLSGLQIIESAALVKQFRFPRSKKKRIRAKWAKRDENYRPDPNYYQMDGKIYAHPATAARFYAQIEIDKNNKLI